MSLRRKKNSILPELIFSKFFLILVVILFLTILLALGKGTVRNFKVNSEINDLQNEISNLERQNQEFGQLVNYLKSDSFIEQEAKLKLGYKNPGEQLVVIPQEEITNEVEAEKNIDNTLPNPAKWWAYFFN